MDFKSLLDGHFFDDNQNHLDWQVSYTYHMAGHQWWVISHHIVIIGVFRGSLDSPLLDPNLVDRPAWRTYQYPWWALAGEMMMMMMMMMVMVMMVVVMSFYKYGDAYDRSHDFFNTNFFRIFQRNGPRRILLISRMNVFLSSSPYSGSHPFCYFVPNI